MLNTSSLSNIFWLNKTKNKENIVLSEGSVRSLEMEISKNNLNGFLKISKNSNLSKLTIISSVFSFLLNEYFDDFQFVIRLGASGLVSLENEILLDVADKKEITFKDSLKDFANGIKEAVIHSNYDTAEFDLSKYSNFSIQYGLNPESVKDNLSLFIMNLRKILF